MFGTTPFELDLWQHNANIARMHEVERYSDEHMAVLEHYVQSLAALGQKASRWWRATRRGAGNPATAWPTAPTCMNTT